VAAAAAAMHDNMQHVLVEGTGDSPIENLDALLSLYDRPVATLCNNVWMSRIRAEVQQRNLCLLLTGEVGNWTISAGSYSILGEYLRERRWGEWQREALALGANGQVRYRGILVSSLSPWLPRWLLEVAAPLSSGINSASHNPAHPRLADEISKRRRSTLGTHSRAYYERNLETLINRDFGDHRKASLAGWGIDERDPTADRRLAEFCLSLPVNMLLRKGERRPLAKAALSDRLPPRVLDQKIKGYQGADWHEGLTANRQAILDLIEDISSDTMASDLLDLPAMRDWVRNWPSGGWDDLHVTARYRTALLVGLSAGHFALRANR
jgi:asparagine synthase (glutamine-hydrolysing)